MGYIVKKVRMTYGFEFENVYFKINRISYNDDNRELYFAGEFYLSKQHQQDGFPPLENSILCEVLILNDKTVNIYEYVYNYIKEKAEEVVQYTDEYIESYNNDLMENHKNDGPIIGLINKNYALFVDAIKD